MGTRFPLGVDLLLAAYLSHKMQNAHGRNIEHLRAIRNRNEPVAATPSYTGAVEVTFSNSETTTFNAEEVKRWLATRCPHPGPHRTLGWIPILSDVGQVGITYSIELKSPSVAIHRSCDQVIMKFRLRTSRSRLKCLRPLSCGCGPTSTETSVARSFPSWTSGLTK